jgi:hypothetical protein
LGPYRNLTTLTALILAIHPNCQVLNHAAKRIFGNKKIDFLNDFSKSKLDRFTQFALRISAAGHSGPVGGSITHSHAFRSNRSILESRISDTVTKRNDTVECLIWKESLRTSNIIRDRKVNLEKIFNIDRRLKFLLPIRNPLDCAISNLRTGHVKLFKGLNQEASIIEVVKAIIDEILWFAKLEQIFPERFFHYFEYSITSKLLNDLAKFLLIDPADDWIKTIISNISINPGYNHDKDLIKNYRDYILEMSSEFPDFERGLLRFVSN